MRRARDRDGDSFSRSTVDVYVRDSGVYGDRHARIAVYDARDREVSTITVSPHRDRFMVSIGLPAERGWILLQGWLNAKGDLRWESRTDGYRRVRRGTAKMVREFAPLIDALLDLHYQQLASLPGGAGYRVHDFPVPSREHVERALNELRQQAPVRRRS